MRPRKFLVLSQLAWPRGILPSQEPACILLAQWRPQTPCNASSLWAFIFKFIPIFSFSSSCPITEGSFKNCLKVRKPILSGHGLPDPRCAGWIYCAPQPRPFLVHAVKKKLLSTLCVIYCQNLLQDFSALLNEAGLFSVHIGYPCLVTPSHVGSVSGCPGSPSPLWERGCRSLALILAWSLQGVSLPPRWQR